MTTEKLRASIEKMQFWIDHCTDSDKRSLYETVLYHYKEQLEQEE